MPKIHMKSNTNIMIKKKSLRCKSDANLVVTNSGIGNPSVYHALVVIFLEFFAWGLLTMPVINVSTLLLGLPICFSKKKM